MVRGWRCAERAAKLFSGLEKTLMSSVAAPDTLPSPSQTQRLRALFDQSPAYKAVFLSLARLSKPKGGSDLHRLRKVVLAAHNVSIGRAGMRELFGQLQKLGIGKFICGTGNDPDRFQWTNNPKAVGDAASGHAMPHARGLSTTESPQGKGVSFMWGGKRLELPLSSRVDSDEIQVLVSMLRLELKRRGD